MQIVKTISEKLVRLQILVEYIIQIFIVWVCQFEKLVLSFAHDHGSQLDQFD
ncbi:7448_t:CDS:2 [Entrophospora sp. SA101]|nr:7448_t:CDS:2 [Entrophospora sp. SA101]